MNEYVEIAKQILAETDAKLLPTDQLLQLQDKVANQLERKVGLALVEQLSEQDAKQYMALLANAVDSETSSAAIFLSEKIPNISQVVEQAVETYIQDFFSAQQSAKSA